MQIKRKADALQRKPVVALTLLENRGDGNAI